jgi:hypothetical protein
MKAVRCHCSLFELYQTAVGWNSWRSSYGIAQHLVTHSLSCHPHCWVLRCHSLAHYRWTLTLPTKLQQWVITATLENFAYFILFSQSLKMSSLAIWRIPSALFTPEKTSNSRSTFHPRVRGLEVLSFLWWCVSQFCILTLENALFCASRKNCPYIRHATATNSACSDVDQNFLNTFHSCSSFSDVYYKLWF